LDRLTAKKKTAVSVQKELAVREEQVARPRDKLR
jgi:hypothetical protein